ncbi:RimJ/RimL family protein N-acetyltransferase [Lysobacter niastensis]|uniref:RimJ/RimL family protein N-acetyltransferase n=1 Tax=Lysobacter niastensis TaxID=380629 RepID=A0ABU1WDE0_9GAMM|nr:GNAT family N-acetyltransferase [Lysobacter niastensis]MDR7135623.1 RimJ/RimL family protein N-acetyltransferase [Lysobacter niastensis]
MIELTHIDVDNLRRLAAREPVDFGDVAVSVGALPPRHVAVRALTHLDAGTPPLWCMPFLIMPRSHDAILGGCTFKAAPVDGRVEIGYGVAPSHRGRGIATAAVTQLLYLAAASGIVRQVIAHVLPGNFASATVVSRLGFEMGSSFVDTDDEEVVRWTWHVSR